MSCLQHIPFRKGAFHDIPSATHDRRHASAESRTEHANLLRATGVPVRASLREITGTIGPEDIRAYQVYLTNEKKLATGSILIAVAALRFLYKVSLKKDWSFEDVIPAPKKPQKLPVCPSPGASTKSRMGRICQAALCWPPAGARLRRPLHPPCRDLEPSTTGYRSWSSALPAERLSRQRPAENDDAFCRGIHPPVSPSRFTGWVPAHSLLWLARQSPPAREAGPMPPIAGHGTSSRDPGTRGLSGPA